MGMFQNLSALAVRQLVDEHLSGRRDYGQELWLLLIFELWHRNYLESERVCDSQGPVASLG